MIDVDQSLLDSLARHMRSESSEQLGERVRDGIPAILPHEGGTEMRVPTPRQFLEAWVASHELERRARGLAGEPPPRPIIQVTAIEAPFVEHPPIHPPGYVFTDESGDEIPPEKPEWWDATERHALAEVEEVEPVDLPRDITVEELEAMILRGMPRREEDVWRIPSPQELAEAHAALAALVVRAREER